MRQSEAGIKVVKAILDLIHEGLVPLPGEISLKQLEEMTGCRVQTIGMAYDDYISKPLKAKGIETRKCNSPVVIQFSRACKSICV